MRVFSDTFKAHGKAVGAVLVVCLPQQFRQNDLMLLIQFLGFFSLRPRRHFAKVCKLVPLTWWRPGVQLDSTCGDRRDEVQDYKLSAMLLQMRKHLQLLDRLNGFQRDRRGFGLVHDEWRGLLLRLNVGHCLHPDLRQFPVLLHLLLLHLLLVDMVEDSGTQSVALHIHHRGGAISVHKVDQEQTFGGDRDFHKSSLF
ncbi:hypothetical protein EYF80_024354 [Liparis tanakae]|uniref:Uncharacterized protein n=1 Tax=Liparis tanakae TaxID=230148 RepID=A0A4Z2HKH7_9TELE|nr:hypothetical protein EYF80_024354 [Liparis tanakae]